MNNEKTDKGRLVNSYACDPRTCCEEFVLSKRQYYHSTGRMYKNEVIAYQIRQSFKPGEISAEDANRVGYELAMRFTKGKYAFVVATHTDRAHIHNHIIFNSTSIDGTQKFRDFRRSGLALQKVSDMVCLENGLSVIEPRPKSERERRTDYPKRNSFRNVIREDIRSCIKRKPKDFEELDMCLDNIYIGTRNLLTAKLYMNLAKSYAAGDDTKDAIDTIDLAMRIERNLFDFEDVYPGLVEVYYTYAEILYQKGEAGEAENYYNNSIELANDSFGENHLQTAAAYFARGQYTLHEQRYDEAESDFSNAIEIRRNMLCLKQPETVDYYIGLAYAHIGEQKVSEAVEALDEAKDICDALSLSDEYYDRINDVYELCQ